MRQHATIQVLISLLVSCLAGLASAADLEKVQHPFLLWTAEDLRALRKKIETQPWAKEAYEAMVSSTDRQGDEIRHLFRYAVMQDREAGRIEKQRLLSLLKAPDPLGSSLDWRILAYDVLYPELSDDEREAIERRLRRYVQYAIRPGGTYDATLYNNERNYARYDGEEGHYTRTNWLPNIIFPWKLSANLAAAVLRDEKLIRETWARHGSVQWYFDEYLCDSGFYSEEFSKTGSTPGTLLMYCTAVRNLGLDELGFGYQGRGGATMRGHLESLLHLTFPCIDLGSTRPRYPRVSAGDVRPWMPLEHATVEGHFADGRGGNETWRSHGAWGGTTRDRSPQWDNDKTEKMQIRLWFEWGHRLWPEAGFDYFLAQMRGPRDDVYTPTLYFGLDPIGPQRARPPAASSAIHPERGIVMLRAVEGPDYWESEAPAVCLRLAANYAHNVNDAFALCGFYAFNRPIYLNPKSDPGYAFGFSRSVRSHCSVMVDGHVKVDDWGRTGSIEPQFTSDCHTRHLFQPEVKFVAARTDQRYPGVDETRVLALTREYLLDVFSCSDARPHSYVWIAHTYGKAETEPGDRWRPSHDLADLIKELGDERSLETRGRDWSVTVRQQRPAVEPKNTPLGEAWWRRNVGVRLRMLGQPDTTAYLTSTPKPPGDRPDRVLDLPLVDGVTILASRKANDATFVALHEPFEGQPVVARFDRIAQSPQAMAMRVAGRSGSSIDDRILLRMGDDFASPITLRGDGEQFVFADFAYLRIGRDRIVVRGDLHQLKLPVGRDRPKLIVNGRPVDVDIAEDVLIWEE
jgi:hypothetical protein